jgi:UDP-N-acetylmuramate--alanine ligase
MSPGTGTGRTPLRSAPDGSDGVAGWGRTHLIGVGGAGMSAIAALLAARGVEVTGSDARDSAALASLRDLGVPVWVGHDAGHVEGAQRVVVSSAVRDSNPELAHARALGLTVLHRSQALAALMHGRLSVAVAGAHGKTTTSAMIAVTLAGAGLDPSCAIGGTVLAANTTGLPAAGGTGAVGGAWNGSGDAFVAEADESDGSFLAYSPTVAVVTNVEADHLDHYGSLAAFEEVFVRFTERIVDGGWLVTCADDAGARRLVDRVRDPLAARGIRVVTYGSPPAAGCSDGALVPDVTVTGYRPHGDGGSVVLQAVRVVPAAGPVDLVLTVPGAHNAANAAAAWTVALLLGVGPEEAASALAQFRGTGRRFEDRGSADGVRVVDDYAHHPTEVAALLRGARPAAGSGRILALFQPHLFSRTRAFAREFAEALELADVVVVTGVYAAREDPDPTVTGELITQQIVEPGKACYVADREEAAHRIAMAARPGDLVLTVGAGDVTELASVILADLARRAAAGPDGEGRAR